MTPVSSATSVPTANAFCMKWNRSKSWTSASRSQTGWSTNSGARVLVVPDRLLLADHYDPAVPGPQHLDRCAVEPRERLGPDHVLGPAGHDLALGDVDDAVEEREDGVDVVGHQQDGDALVGADPLDQAGDGLLAVEVQALQWLVQEQHPGARHESLSDQDPLLLAARHLAQRALRVSVRTHQPDGAPDALARGPAREGERQAPAGSVEAQPHKVQAPDPKVGIEGSALRQVAHVVVAPPHPPAEDADRPLSQWHQPQGALHQRRLAGAVGAQDGRELALADLEVHVPPDEPGAEPDAGVLEADRGPGQISLRAPPAAI